MEPVRSLGGVVGAVRVQERAAGGGGKKDAEAFRRALEQETGGEPGDQRSPGGQPPLRTQLQAKAVASRRAEAVTARHVDVIA